MVQQQQQACIGSARSASTNHIRPLQSYALHSLLTRQSKLALHVKAQHGHFFAQGSDSEHQRAGYQLYHQQHRSGNRSAFVTTNSSSFTCSASQSALSSEEGPEPLSATEKNTQPTQKESKLLRHYFKLTVIGLLVLAVLLACSIMMLSFSVPFLLFCIPMYALANKKDGPSMSDVDSALNALSQCNFDNFFMRWGLLSAFNALVLGAVFILFAVVRALIRKLWQGAPPSLPSCPNS